jgi:GH24 family phage-related lysozyme (muramidase)
MDTASYLDESMAKIEEFEGRVPWLYLDEPGLVTVGVGNMLPNVLAAERLPFQNAAGILSTTDEIKADFSRVAAMSPNHLPTFYLCSTSIRLTDYTIESLLFRVVTEVDGYLRNFFSRFEVWPTPAKLATLDMVYNLGPGRFGRGYPNLIRALFAQNWTDAATESARDNKDAAFILRNQWTRDSYLAALPVRAPEPVS